MMRPDLLACADLVLRGARDRWDRPFGGLQLILVGDFFQLPPVADAAYYRMLRARGLPVRRFIFESRLFYELVDEVVDFAFPHRHRDPDFAALLARARLGHRAMTPRDRELLASRVGAPLPRDDGIVPTRMYSLNRRVASENAAELGRLPGGEPPRAFAAGMALEVDAKLRRLFAARRALARKCKAWGADGDEALRLAEEEAGKAIKAAAEKAAV